MSSFALLDHVNLNISQWTPDLQRFWFEDLGFAPDPRTDMVFKMVERNGGGMKGLVWANIGLQQIHMPLGEPENSSQRIRGTVGFTFPDLHALKTRLRERGVAFEEEDTGLPNQLFGPGVKLRTPTGVQIQLHGGAAAYSMPEVIDARLTLPGQRSIGSGMPYVELLCASGAAAGIGRFYRETLGVPVQIHDCACVVPVGNQALIFREVAGAIPDYDGHHVAVFVGNISEGDTSESFASMYERVKATSLVYNNPRFPHLTYNTLADAIKHGEFRILDIVDPQTGTVVYQLEHEIRSLEHPTFNGRELASQVRKQLLGEDSSKSKL